jgi:hypothetical protein
MSNTNTGGPAFPSGLIDPSTPEDAVQSLHNGMTLRDYFAAKALQGFIGTETEGGMLYDRVAEVAYLYADAMLKARQA